MLDSMLIEQNSPAILLRRKSSPAREIVGPRSLAT